MGENTRPEGEVDEYGFAPGDIATEQDAAAGVLSQDQTDILKQITTLSASNTLEKFYAAWMIQMGDNARRGGEDRKSVADFRLPIERDKETVIVVGPGASSDLYRSYFPKLREAATIVACPTSVHWAMSNGLTPDFVVSADSNESQPMLLDKAGYHGPVLASVTCHPDIDRHGQVYWYAPLMGNGEPEPEKNEFNWWDIPVMTFNQDIDWNYPSVGCVINMTARS